MKIFFFFVYLLLVQIIYCQQDNSNNIYWNFYNENKTKKFIIGVNNCYIRSQASYNSSLIDSLQLGAIVTAKKEDENEDIDKNNLKLRGINAGWYKINYTNNKGKDINGFIWKGFLALSYITENNFTFLTTIEKIESLPKNNMQTSIGIIALNNNKEIIDKKTIKKKY